MKKTIWSYLILFCVCLLVFITIVASAEESLGENIILEEAVGDQTLDRMNYSVYNAEIKQWDPSTVNAVQLLKVFPQSENENPPNASAVLKTAGKATLRY